MPRGVAPVTTGPYKDPSLTPCLLLLTARPQLRALIAQALPRRRARLRTVRTAEELRRAFRSMLIDAALIDLALGEEAWHAAALAWDLPSAPFFGLTTLRTTDAPILARCAELGLADVLIHGVDDPALPAIILPSTFRARFAAALAEPPDILRLGESEKPGESLQRRAWTCVVAHAGLPVRTDTVARTVGVTREHLSRTFGRRAARTSLKQMIDLVRLVAAAELAKNPGLDLQDVATVLRFTSLAHLTLTTQRVAGVRPASLTRLRAVDLFERFA